MRTWNTLEECRDYIGEIREAMSKHYNKLGGAVWGQDKAGVWHMLSGARVDKGNPIGLTPMGEQFVLRAVEVHSMDEVAK